LSPLTRDPDAVIIDSTNLTPEQVVEKIEEHLGQSLKREANPPPAEEG